jgi:uncharacterized protein
MNLTIAGVETAVPAFIGYTERAGGAEAAALNGPVRITSVREYEQRFGRGMLAARPAGAPIFSVTRSGDVRPLQPLFSLYESVRLFYANGGGPCVVVSVGTYVDATGTWAAISGAALLQGLAAVASLTGPTLLVIPDASRLPVEAWGEIATAMLQQAGESRDRLALLDVPQVRGFDAPPRPALADAVAAFRAAVGTDHLSYGAAYAPYLHTSIVSPADLDETIFPAAAVADRLGTPQLDRLYAQAARLLNLLPASAAVAGVMHAVDSDRGVWTAPANVALNDVIEPAFAIDDETQGDLNLPLDGKAINAIRQFPGRGTTVWGARTLDGNSQDFRYVPVRRSLIYLEQSIAIALRGFTTAANDARTWASVVGMVSDFLEALWKDGGLTGAKPDEAFSVQCGLGTTMTQQDVLDGNLVVVVLVAITHPAEFIELDFTQRVSPPEKPD